jgi:hypothetical protein
VAACGLLAAAMLFASRGSAKAMDPPRVANA